MATTYQLLQLLPEARADGRPEVLQELLDEIGSDAEYVTSTLGAHWRGLDPRSPEARRQQRMAADGRWIGTVAGNREVMNLASLYKQREAMQASAFEVYGIRVVADATVPPDRIYVVRAEWEES